MRLTAMRRTKKSEPTTTVQRETPDQPEVAQFLTKADEQSASFYHALKALELGLRYAEQLARQHGKLLDQSAEARRLAETWNAERRFLF